MVLLATSSFNYFLDAAGGLGIVGAIVTGFVTVRKLGPEKNALFITSAQGAATIQNSLIKTLQGEVDRERARSDALALEVERLAGENAKLRSANLALKRRRGSREEDRPGGG